MRCQPAIHGVRHADRLSEVIYLLNFKQLQIQVGWEVVLARCGCCMDRVNRLRADSLMIATMLRRKEILVGT